MNMRRTLCFGLASGLLLTTACGGDDEPAEGDGAGASAGSIAISGSSTVAPISGLVADVFNDDGSPASITVDDPGTGDGFQLFCEGSIDIADASRPIKDEEAAACEEAGVEFVELEVAFDGISVLTSPDNDLECLTTTDLYAIFGPESSGFDTWEDAAALAESLGSTTEFPTGDLAITAPGTESGTYDAFLELALGGTAEAQAEAGAITEDEVGTSRSDYSSQADDNAIISGIEGTATSFGFVGFAFAEGAGDQVREIAIDGGDGCVEPSIETIADASYPLSRSLFIYVNTGNLADNPALGEYVDFYLTDTALDELVLEAGYVPLPDDRRAATRDAWDAAG